MNRRETKEKLGQSIEILKASVGLLNEIIESGTVENTVMDNLIRYCKGLEVDVSSLVRIHSKLPDGRISLKVLP